MKRSKKTKKKKNSSWLIYALLIIGTLLAVEVVSIALLTYSDFKEGISLKSALLNRWKEYPLNSKPVYFGHYDPLLSSRYPCETDLGGFSTNKHGIIHNGNNDPVLNTFPQKPDNVFRIFFMGGSSAMGAGLHHNNQTISAKIEKNLNERASGEKRFQVINFGASGGHTYSELSWFLSELIYYQPDMLITFDGWNDAVAQDFEYHRQHLSHPMMNWGQLNYLCYETMKGLDAPSMRTPYFLTYATLAFRRYYLIPHLQKFREKAYAENSLFRNGKVFWDQKKNFHFLTEKNLEIFTSITRDQDIYYLAYLQPYASAYYEKSPEFEKKLRDKLAFCHAQYGVFWEEQAYNKKMKQAFDDYEKYYTELEQQHAQNSKNHFQSIVDFFASTSEDVYRDQIHYNDRGTTLLAERFTDDIIDILKKNNQWE